MKTKMILIAVMAALLGRRRDVVCATRTANHDGERPQNPLLRLPDASKHQIRQARRLPDLRHEAPAGLCGRSQHERARRSTSELLFSATRILDAGFYEAEDIDLCRAVRNRRAGVRRLPGHPDSGRKAGAPGFRRGRRSIPARQSSASLPELTADSSLSNYLAFALLNSPAVEAAYYDWAASVENITVARSLPDPQITFQADIMDIVT